MNAPRVFWLHVHQLQDWRRRVWAIEQGGRYQIATRVTVKVPLETVFRGPDAKQPKAFLRGRGIVRWRGRQAVIEAN